MSNQRAIMLTPPVTNHYGDTQFYQPPVEVGPLTLKPPKFTIKSHEELVNTFSAVTQKQLPKRFDVRDKLNGNLTHVLNQGQCGSCWTFSSATAASDVFTRVQLNTGASITDGIRISPMSFFNLTDKVIRNNNSVLDGCGGGDPGAAFSYMEQNQIPLVTERCQDYSWYVATDSQNLTTATLNDSWKTYIGKNITPNGTSKCFEKPKSGSHHQFFVKNTYTSTITNKDPQDLLQDLSGYLQTAVGNQANIKNHLINYGSIVCGIPVFRGFMSGGGNLTISGQPLNKKSWIVADHINNLVDGNVYMQDSSDTQLSGGHAVTVVGWGNNPAIANQARNMLNNKYAGKADKIEQTLKSLGGDLGNYWIIRNSWGYNWPMGDTNDKKLAGYFCLAMYPANLNVQISYPYMKDNLFSMYVTFEPNITCSTDCENKLLTNEPTQLFEKLKQITNVTNQDKDWSGYLDPGAQGGKQYYENTNMNYKEFTSPSSDSTNYIIVLAVAIVIIVILSIILK